MGAHTPYLGFGAPSKIEFSDLDNFYLRVLLAAPHHQKFYLDVNPACIPTFDHGLLQQVYVELPCNQLGQQIPLEQFWRLQKPGGLKWEYYCPCTPPSGTPGIPARCYDVKKQTSPFFGRVYLGCGKTKQRCQWKVRLDQVFAAAAARPPEFPDSEEFEDSFNDEFALLMDELQIKDREMTTPVISTGIPGSDVGGAFVKLFNGLDLSKDESSFLQGNATTLPQLTEEEVAQILSELTLDEGHQMVAFFAGQDNVHVSLDGAIHFNPKWGTEEHASYGELTAVTLNSDEDEDGMGDTTLVKTSPPKLDAPLASLLDIPEPLTSSSPPPK
ncbi:hypothetical protein EV359DRAFT_65742 [Lentinula novae-zelandiae]|nr:hypothetical protein EV359DRAFT_65742 [Lentinula novae-zelandiae]